jgi:hypothetical protein
MKIQTSDIVAIIALIISLGSIWFQDRGVRKQLMVSNISEYTKRYQDILEKLPKIVLDRNFDLNSLADDEKDKLLRTMWLYFDLCYEEYILFYELKLIDKKLWKHWEDAMKSAFARPAFFQCWQIVNQESFYPKSFSKFVKEKMIELHAPGRKIT